MNRMVVLCAVWLYGCSSSSESQAEVSGETEHVRGESLRVVAIGPAIADVVVRLRPDVLVAVDDASHEIPSLAHLPKVGFSRNLSVEGVLSVSPTLVLVPERTGPEGAVEQIRGAGIRVEVVPQVRSLEGVRALTRTVAASVERNADGLLSAFDKTCEGVGGGSGKTAMFVYARGMDSVSVSGTGTAGAAMLALGGLTNGVANQEGYKPLTPEAAASVNPDVLVFTTKGLESLGGLAGVSKIPGLGLTNAVKMGAVVAVDDLQLLAFGLDTCLGARDLSNLSR